MTRLEANESPPVTNTSTGQSNGGRTFYCKGSWTVSTCSNLGQSTCSTDWKEVF